MALSYQEVDLLRTFADSLHLLEILWSTGEPVDLKERVREAIITALPYSSHLIQRIAEGQPDLVRIRFTLALFRSRSC